MDPAEKDTLYPAIDHNKEHMFGFEDNKDEDDNKVHDSMKPHGKNDFPNEQFHFDIRNGRQFITIEEDAKVAKNCLGHGDSGGDVGIHRTHKAKEDEIYGKAKVRITDETEQLPEDFKSRLTIHARDQNGKMIPGSECNAYNAPKNQTPEFVIAEIFSCPMLDDTGRIRIATRAHAVPKRSDPLNPNLAVQGWGTVAVEWVSFTKKACGGTGASC